MLDEVGGGLRAVARLEGPDALPLIGGVRALSATGEPQLRKEHDDE
jgi:hypothetical protein